MAGLNYLDANNWRYDNAGSADLLSISGTTLTNLPVSKSITGTAFYQTQRVKCFDLPNTPEVWMKFDVYFDGSNRWRAYNDNSNGVNGVCSYNSNLSFGMWQNSNRIQDFSGVCKTNQLQTVLLHMISGSTVGVIEAWVDGSKIYTYTGDVNHGQDFADLYLQSDGSGTFFSNIIISNAEIGLDENVPSYDIAIKPEIVISWVSWVPMGQVALNPLIFASYIPAPIHEKISADLLRKLSNTESNNADLLRQIAQSDKGIADASRLLKKTERVIADTSRKMGITTIRADLLRYLKATTISKGDSCRQVGIREKVSSGTQRLVANYERAIADSFRRVATTEKITADLLRAIREFARFDVTRKIIRVEKTIARTVIRVPHILRYVIQDVATPTMRLLANAPDVDDEISDSDSKKTENLVETFSDYGVTAVNITLTERTLSDEFRFDIAVPMEINEAVEGDLLDYSFKFLVEETSQTDLIQSVKGMYNQDALLYTQFFLPTYIVDDKEEVIPRLASDYMAKIAELLGLKSDIKIDDFTPYNLNGQNLITYVDLLNSLFSWTSRLPQRQINVFIRGDTLYCIQRGKESSTFDITDLTYSRPTVSKKLIRSLWSSPKPEKNDDDDDEPIVDYQYDENPPPPFSGTISFSDEGVSSKLVYEKGLLSREENHSSNSKTTLDSAVSYEYIEIFPNMSDLQVTLKKAFDKNFYGDFYLAHKALRNSSQTLENYDEYHSGNTDIPEYTKNIQRGEATFDYSETDSNLYLSREVDTTITEIYETQITTNSDGSKSSYMELTDSETDVRETYHVPIGNGWYGQSVYHNGKAQGSNISQGTPGNRVSQYTIGEVQKILSGWTVTYNISGNDDKPKTYEDWRRKLAPIADISFPVRELDLLSVLTADLLWLNRKIQETVTVDLISKVDKGIPEIDHIVDFTERIKFNGNEYFLVSNKITFTPRKLIQKLQLIRWY